MGVIDLEVLRLSSRRERAENTRKARMRALIELVAGAAAHARSMLMRLMMMRVVCYSADVFLD